MFALFVKLAVVLALLYLQNILTVDNSSTEEADEKAFWLWETVKFMETIIDEYRGSFGTQCINGLNILYANLTLVNVVVFIFKYVPTSLFMYRYMKNYYLSKREHLQRKQQEFEDIKLQVKVATTKLSVREAEHKERSEELRRGLQRLRGVRARVRQALADDDDLRRAAESNALAADIDTQHAQNNPEQEQKILIELMKDLKIERTKLSEVETENTYGEYGEYGEYGQYVPAEPSSPEASVYSSASESQKECQVKIVKVTNVYKVSYLRHFIKQKRLRRASKQALLKRKMEDIKKLLEDWQKTLNMVINSKLAIVDIDTNHMELASQEAMGDFSKPPLRDSSDTDSDISWYPNAFRNSPYCFQESADMDMSREYYEPGEGEVALQTGLQTGLQSGLQAGLECEWGRPRLANNLFVVTEETSSQLAIQEVKSEAGDDWDCNDIASCDLAPLS